MPAPTLQPQHNPFLELRSPRRPGRPVPRLVRRLLPDPMCEGGWRRFLGYDVPAMSVQEVRRELWRLQVAMTFVDDGDVPPWCWDRLARLREALRPTASTQYERAAPAPEGPIPLEWLG